MLFRSCTVTRRLILQKARRHPSPKAMGLRLLVGNRFQVLFHSPPGVLFTFPSRYWFTIGGKECLALGGGPPEFPQGFSGPAVLGNATGALPPFPTGLSPSLAGRSSPVQIKKGFLTPCPVHRPSCSVPRPRPGNAGELFHQIGLGFFPFARRY